MSRLSKSEGAQLVSLFIKQCEQCKNYKNIINMKFFPEIKELYESGHVNEAPDRYYCNECMSTWDMALEGYTREEAAFEQPIAVWESGVKIL